MALGAFGGRKRQNALIALSVGLGVSLSCALLGVMFDVGDKVNQELKSYGANLNVVPRGASMLSEMYLLEDTPEALSDTAAPENFIPENELYKIKMIFWAYNIVNFAPYLTTPVKIGDKKALLTGTWFNKRLDLPTGEETEVGITALKPWWKLNGPPGDDLALNEVLVGGKLSKELNLSHGDVFTVEAFGQKTALKVRAIFDGGGPEDEMIYAPMALAQSLASKPGLDDSVEVSALTTPENDLARRAALNPESLTRLEWDAWYCTAYISSIAYQIEEVLPHVRVKAIRRVAESEGAILGKIQLLMILLTILTLLCSALAISNLVTAGIMERSVEIGLLKALGASNLSVTFLFLLELFLVAAIGGALGYFLGLGLAQIIGLTVFGSTVDVKAAVVPLTGLMVVFVALLGSVPAIKALTHLKPTEVLHGR
jgi:putative ABC transport system permease protein